MAIRAVVAFLGKSFRGRFLPVEAAVGAIGRNLSDRVRLLLDGPARNPDELPPTTQDA